MSLLLDLKFVFLKLHFVNITYIQTLSNQRNVFIEFLIWITPEKEVVIISVAHSGLPLAMTSINQCQIQKWGTFSHPCYVSVAYTVQTLYVFFLMYKCNFKAVFYHPYTELQYCEHYVSSLLCSVSGRQSTFSVEELR